MPYFTEEKVIGGQVFAHYGMLEIYVHIVASLLLFLVSLLCIALLYQSIRNTRIRWPGLLHGFFYTGLIGLGEAVEHFFRWEPFLNTALHYLHHMAALAAMLFFYLAVNEYYYACSHPDEELPTISNEVAMGVLGGVMLVAIFMGSLAQTPWDVALEIPFLLLILIPLLLLTIILLNTTRRIRKSMLAFYFPALGAVLSLLVLDIWIGRLADAYKSASGYIIAHSLQNVLHAAVATLMLLFVLAIREGIREDVLYECEVSVKAPKRKRPSVKPFPLNKQ